MTQLTTTQSQSKSAYRRALRNKKADAMSQASSAPMVPQDSRPYHLSEHKKLVQLINNFLDTFHQNSDITPSHAPHSITPQAQDRELNFADKLILDFFQKKKEIQELKPKRVEEKQKMFFKKGFKYVENSFFQQKYKKKKIQKRFKNYSEFYNFYFQETSQQYNIPLINYHHPQKSTLKNSQTGQRSFNQVYIDLILASDQFRRDMKEYMNNYFFKETIMERDNKIEKFISKCYKIISECEQEIRKQLRQKYHGHQISEIWQLVNFHTEKLVEAKLEEYIIKNPKCKIPWSLSELDETQQFASRYIDNFENQLLVGNVFNNQIYRSSSSNQEEKQRNIHNYTHDSTSNSNSSIDNHLIFSTPCNQQQQEIVHQEAKEEEEQMIEELNIKYHQQEATNYQNYNSNTQQQYQQEQQFQETHSWEQHKMVKIEQPTHAEYENNQEDFEFLIETPQENKFNITPCQQQTDNYDQQQQGLSFVTLSQNLENEMIRQNNVQNNNICSQNVEFQIPCHNDIQQQRDDIQFQSIQFNITIQDQQMPGFGNTFSYDNEYF